MAYIKRLTKFSSASFFFYHLIRIKVRKIKIVRKLVFMCIRVSPKKLKNFNWFEDRIKVISGFLFVHRFSFHASVTWTDASPALTYLVDTLNPNGYSGLFYNRMFHELSL